MEHVCSFIIILQYLIEFRMVFSKHSVDKKLFWRLPASECKIQNICRNLKLTVSLQVLQPRASGPINHNHDRCISQDMICVFGTRNLNATKKRKQTLKNARKLLDEQTFLIIFTSKKGGGACCMNTLGTRRGSKGINGVR